MLIRVRDLQLIAVGRIPVVFRRWTRPTVKSGGTLRTTVGVLSIEFVEPIVEAELSASDANAAGFSDVDAVRVSLSNRTEGPLFRIRLHLQGADPRTALRNATAMSSREVGLLQAKLDRMDRSFRYGAWTLKILEAVRNDPGRRAADLALRLSLKKEWLKVSIRKLKELGLTESLDVGYRISPRGAAFLSHTARGDA